MMDILSFIINATSIIGMLAIATLSIVNNTDKLKIFFSISIYSSSVWLLLQFVVQFMSLKDNVGLVLIQLSSAMSFVVAVFLYLFVREFLGRHIPKITYYLLASLFVIELALNLSGCMIQNAFGDLNGITIDRASYFYTVYMIIVGLIMFSSLYELLKDTIRDRSKKSRTRNYLLIAGFLQAVIIILISNVFFQSSAEAQMSFPVSLLLFSLLIGTAIIKYQLFDIRLAAVRVVAYVLSLLTLSIAYYALALIVSITVFKGQLSNSVSISPINIALALILAFIFQPVKKFFDKITNKIFYSDRYDSDEFFARLNRTLSSTTDLRGLLKRAANEISSTLKADHAFFYINTFEDRYITVGTSDRKQFLIGDVREIQSVYGVSDGVIVASFLDALNPIRKLMISHRIEIILPLIQSDHIIGYLCLGYHKNAGYKDRDLKVLETISDELNIAIQNALSIEEVRDLNATLQQRVDEATKELRASNAQLQRLDKMKDEFVSIASHQLRTPLTSVKGYISMVLEGDAGEINDNQRKLLDEAFNSSERMVHLIGDFLNVSRLQTGKFVIDKNPTDLAKIVQEEVDGLQPSAISRDMKLVYKCSKNIPIINLDEGKFRQVIMNFADNAIYYSRENSTINISLSVEDNEVVYTVKDTGIGVPNNERAQLFTKFYRASNAKKQRPDGTGVGLFLAKKIVDSHGGQIIFESVESKGSTFGFRLPIK